MRVGDLAFGLVILGIALAPLVAAAVSVRRRCMSSWPRAVALLAQTVLVLSVVTVATQLLGVIGMLNRWAIVATFGACGLGAVALLRIVGSPPSAQPAPGGGRRWWTKPGDVIAAVATAAVVAPWIGQSIDGLRRGMAESVDTLWYHGPMSARFAQEGSITSIHHFDTNPVTAYYPGGTSLLHATGILAVGDDVLSPLFNLGFFAMACLAACAIGRALGSGVAGLLAVLVVLGLPMLVGDARFGQPGSEYNDVVGMALVLSAAALLVAAPTSRMTTIMAGLAAGLAVGTKLSMLAPVAALTIGVIFLTNRGKRVRAVSLWIFAGIATGGFWFVRNIVAARSPLPGVELPLGPLTPPSLPTPSTDYIARYLLRPAIRENIIFRGLDDTLGPAWWLILSVVLCGGFAVFMRGVNPASRMLGGVAVAAFVAYLFTPTFIGSPPFLFASTVRFASTALALGLVSIGGLSIFQSRTGRRTLIGLLAGILIATQFEWRVLWGAGSHEALPAWITVAVVAGTVGFFVGHPTAWASRTSRVAVVALGVGCVAITTWHVQREQFTARETAGSAFNPVVASLADVHDARIATEGLFLQYPLYGDDLSNHVQYLGRPDGDGGLAPLTTCVGWKRAINAGLYDYLLIGADHYPIAPLVDATALEWADTEIDLGLTEIERDGRFAATFEVRGSLDVRRCP